MEKICTKCGELKNIEEFTPYYGESRKVNIRRNICKKCKNKKQIETIKNNPKRLESVKNYMKNYYKKNNFILKVKAYRSFDKKKGFDSISLDEFRQLLKENSNCFYCHENNPSLLGLDRKDNLKGHLVSNVVICCEKCNNILSDLPFEAKLLLKDGLSNIKSKDLLNNWQIKTKRIK